MVGHCARPRQVWGRRVPVALNSTEVATSGQAVEGLREWAGAWVTPSRRCCEGEQRRGWGGRGMQGKTGVVVAERTACL